MVQWIVKDFKRVDRGLIEEFREIPTSVLSDCMNRFQGMESSIQALQSGARLCGSAFTIQSIEACNWAAHHALVLAKSGDVLVVAARGSMKSNVWGHMMTYAARKQGLAGVVIDGCVRDGEKNRKDSLPVFCRGVCPGGPHKGWPGNICIPVSCGGVVVMPGDIIIGDGDGVTVVPMNRAEQVLEEAQKRMIMEEDWYKRIRQGETTVEILGLEKVDEF